MNAAEELEVVTPARAADVLCEMFGPLLEEEYLAGKTRFRDAICARLGVSELEAEELCDDLEESGRIAYIRGDEGAGWQLR